jgi:hypothetical protein
MTAGFCRRDPADVGVPPVITGPFERLLAVRLFFLDVSDAYTILALWIAAKLASNWQRDRWTTSRSPTSARSGFKA